MARDCMRAFSEIVDQHWPEVQHQADLMNVRHLSRPR